MLNVTLRARHVLGSLNVIADGVSRRNQIQSTEWSLSPHRKTSMSHMQDDSDCPRLADKTMVLGPGGTVSGHPKTASTHTHSAKQPPNHYHVNPTSLNLHVWYLIRVQHSKNMVSLQKWQKELLLFRDSPQDSSTPQSGPFSNVGAQKNRWTSGIPL